MNVISPDFYEFEGVRFYAEESELVRLTDGAKFSIRPKERDFLKVLLDRAQETVAYEEIQRIVWPEVVDSQSALRTMRETKRTLDALLRDIIKSSNHIIKTVVNEGYCLRTVVIASKDLPSLLPEGNEVKPERPLTQLKWLAANNWRLGISCALYSLMFAVALPLEVAYKWDLC